MKNNEIQKTIEEIILKTGFAIDQISIEENINKDNTVSTWFKIKIDNPHLFLYNNAQGLLAINHLIKRLIEKENNLNEGENIEKRCDIVIDINDFQKKKIENLHAIAHMMAERSRYFKSSMELEPMSAFERRIIHEFLSDAIDLKTESSGYGPERKVIIKYLGKI